MDDCPNCGLKYRDFRTGFTYAEVYQMLWVASDDARDWRYKRRGTVLGKWRQLKLQMWDRHLAGCRPIPF